MRFVVNDVAATPKAGGVYSILFDFYMDVLNKDHVKQWIFILAGKYFPESENVKIIVRNDLKKSKIKKDILHNLFLYESRIPFPYYLEITTTTDRKSVV